LKYRDIMKDLYQKQNGSAIVLFAISMSVLIAFSSFAFDLGMEFDKASKLQNTLDSVALAATQELPANDTLCQEWQNAQTVANDYMTLNGIENVDNLNITPVYQDGIIGNPITGVTVEDTVPFQYHFARIFGLEQRSITRRATAELQTVYGMSGLAPLCITDSSMVNIQPGEERILKFGSQVEEEDDDDGFFVSSGWFGIVQLDGTGANEYRDDFIYGCSSVINVGDILGMQDGNLSGPTEQAFNTRILGHEGCTYENHEANCPRIVTIPVVTVLESKEVATVGFASFFIQEVTGTGNKSIINATYLDRDIVPGTVIAGPAGDFGVYVVKLTD